MKTDLSQHQHFYLKIQHVSPSRTETVGFLQSAIENILNTVFFFSVYIFCAYCHILLCSVYRIMEQSGLEGTASKIIAKRKAYSLLNWSFFCADMMRSQAIPIGIK